MPKKPDDLAVTEAAPWLVRPPPLVEVALGGRFDSLLVVYTRVPGLEGERFVLWSDLFRAGSGADNDLVLRDTLVSRRHARFERRGRTWWVNDGGSENGTYCNDLKVSSSGVELETGDRIKIGCTIFKLFSAAQWEARGNEESYLASMTDGLTGVPNNRYFLEILSRELVRCRRHGQQSVILLFYIDQLAAINDCYGEMAGDAILAEMARVVKSRLGGDHVLARRGPESFVVLFTGTPLAVASSLGVSIRLEIASHAFVFLNETIRLTVSIGVVPVYGNEGGADELVRCAEGCVFEARVLNARDGMERNGR